MGFHGRLPGVATCALLLMASAPLLAQAGSPPAAPPVPSSLPQSDGQPPRPLGAVNLWVTLDDYPPEAIAAKHEGLVIVRLRVAPLGFVQECSVTQSSGHAELDTATCAALRNRAFFIAATDADGRAVEGSIIRRVRWQIPVDAPATTVPPTVPVVPVEPPAEDEQ